mgnify:CR=1 FL=1
MKLLINEAKGKLNIGDWVRTNSRGDSSLIFPDIEGIIETINDNSFYIRQKENVYWFVDWVQIGEAKNAYVEIIKKAEETTNQPIGSTQSNEPIFGKPAVLCNGTCKGRSAISTCPLHCIFVDNTSKMEDNNNEIWEDGFSFAIYKVKEIIENIMNDGKVAYNKELDTLKERLNAETIKRPRAL